MKSLHETLGVPQNATHAQIKAAYKNRALQLHPDKGGSNEDMQKLNEAYKLLTNPEALKQWEADHPEGTEAMGFDFLTSNAERPSEKYKRVFQAMSQLFESHPLEKINSQERTEAFQELNQPLMTGLLANPQYQNLYRVKKDGISYEDIYQFIAHLAKWTQNNKPLEASLLKGGMSLKRGFDLLSRFLSGDFYGKNLDTVIGYLQQQISLLEHQTYDVNFYKAVAQIMQAKDLTKDYQQITKALDTINSFIYQLQLMEKPEVIALIQNKHFRFFVATVLKQDWQGKPYQSPKMFLLAMKSELNHLQRLIPMSRIHLSIEEKTQKLLSGQATLEEIYDLGYLLIDLMATSITSFSHINSGIMAALCFHHASTVENNSEKAMALECIALCLYQRMIEKAFKTNVIEAFYTANQVIKCLDLLQYKQSTLNIDILNLSITQPGDQDLLNYSGSVSDSIQGIIKRAMYLIDIIPFYVLPKSTIDCQLIEIFQMGMLRASLDALLSKETANNFDYTKVVYHAYELALLGWCVEEKNNQSKAKVIDLKVKAMEALLKTENSSIPQLAEMLDKPFIAMKRDAEGWFSPEIDLDFPEEAGQKIYSDFHGFEFDEEKMEFRFITQEWTKDSPLHTKLFTEFDLRQMFYFFIPGGFLSFDHHDSNKLFDPIQKVRFAPMQLAGTEYLKTLFITDLLLKIFTAGAEISGTPPYLIRSSEELLKRLPEHLQKILNICKDDASNSGHAHRFWIKAGKMDTQTIIENGCERVVFGDPQMSIQKHLLRLAANGELEDAVVDSQDESKEAIFAQQMTKHYDEIGAFFPEFLRLKKLIKIAGAMQKIAVIRHKNLFQIEQSTQILTDADFWKQHLKKALEKNRTTLNAGYQQLPSGLKELLKGLRPTSDNSWWENTKYQELYAKQCNLLSQEVQKFPKFIFNVNDQEVTNHFNKVNNLYHSAYTQIFNDNYEANKNAIIKSNGQAAWNFNESNIRTQLNANIAKDLGPAPNKNSILNDYNQQGIRTKEAIRSNFHSDFIELSKAIGQVAYNNIINQLVQGSYQSLAAASAKDVLNQLKTAWNSVKDDHYKTFQFLEASIGTASLTAHIEQLLLGNIEPLAQAFANYDADMLKATVKKQLQKQQNLEAKFIELQFAKGEKEAKDQHYFVPAVYHATNDRRVYGGVSAFPVFNKVSNLSRDLQSPFKNCKEMAIRAAESFVRTAGLGLGSCLFASATYASTFMEIRSLESDIRSAQNELFWMELNERNKQNQSYFNHHQHNFRYTVESLHPEKSSFFHTNPFAVFRLKNELEKGKQSLDEVRKFPGLQPYYASQQVFSNLYNAVESYAKGMPTSHVDGVGRGVTHAALDIASLVAHPLDNLLYPLSDLIFDATVIAAHQNTLHSHDPDVQFLRTQLLADTTQYDISAKRMQLRGEGAVATLNYYMNAKAEECTKEITRILAPGYFLKAAKTLGTLQANLKNFNQLHVPLFAAASKLTNIEQIYTLSKEAIRRMKGINSQPLMYVITQDGKIIITEAIYDHWLLNEGKPVAAAGDIYLNSEGLIVQIDTRSGTYAPSHPGLNTLVVRKFQEAGFTEVVNSTFCDWSKKMQEFEKMAVQAGQVIEDFHLHPKMYRPYLYPSFFGVSFGAGASGSDNKNAENPSKTSKP